MHVNQESGLLTRTFPPTAGRTFAAVLCDLDGTLVDSIPAVLRSWRLWATEQGIDPDALNPFHGQPAQHIVSRFVEQSQVTAALHRIHSLEVLDVAGVVGLPGAAELLRQIPSDRLAIVTSCTSAVAAVRLGAAGFAAPSCIVSADEVTHGKPHPDPYLLAAQKLGVDIGQCLVIEDSAHGIASGQSAGATTAAVGTQIKGADYQLAGLDELHWQVDSTGVSLSLGQSSAIVQLGGE